MTHSQESVFKVENGAIMPVNSNHKLKPNYNKYFKNNGRTWFVWELLDENNKVIMHGSFPDGCKPHIDHVFNYGTGFMGFEGESFP